MELTLGTKIKDRYEILSIIGKGGMGEVYTAYDHGLGREVALKLMHRTDDEEKIKRFRQEARSVSNLNHPNIVCVYDFDRHEDFHFIVSELVRGETLRMYISHKSLSMKEILEIGCQIGTALSALHRSGVTHRDIKPENIMILPEGHIKILDFGLAKLDARESSAVLGPSDSTASVFHTREGMIAGTIYYMSPEQLRGQPVDNRSDIWSLGAVLFEMIYGQRPFTGENNSDIIVSILERPLPALAKARPDITESIEKILQKALAKTKESRFKDADDFVANLRRAAIDLDADQNKQPNDTNGLREVNNTGQVVSTVEHDIKPTADHTSKWYPARNSFALWLLAALVLVSSVGIVFYNASLITEIKPNENQLKIKRLPVAANIINGVISPDGRFIAFVLNDNGRQSLWLRQVDEVTGKELLPPERIIYSNLSFSPDGNSIFYTVFSGRAVGVLNRIPLLGGTPQEIARNVDSSVTFSPDGNRFAFIRTISSEGLDQIIVVDSTKGGERVLSQKKRPEFYSIGKRESLAWAPDGKTIVSPTGKKDEAKEFMTLVEIDVETGDETPVTKAEWFRIGKVVWTGNPNELLITATPSNAEPFQIVKISRRDGAYVNITNDLSDYYNISITGNQARILGIALDTTSTIFTSSAKNIEQGRQITAGGFDGLGGVKWTGDGKIVFVSLESGNRDIWKMDSNGTGRQRLTFSEAPDDYPAVAGDYIVFVSSRSGTPQIWRMKLDGSEPLQLTYQQDASFPQITPDGKWVIFSARSAGRWALWKVSIDGGDVSPLTSEQTHWASVSPDGKIIACLGQEDVPEAPIKLVLVSAQDGKILNRFNLVGVVASPDIVPVLRWKPNNEAVTYISTENGVSNIYLQPVNGGSAVKITNFSADNLFSFDWSNDGKAIVFARGLIRDDLILIENF